MTRRRGKKGGVVGIREEFGREPEGEKRGGRDKMGKVNRFINYGGAAGQVGGDLSHRASFMLNPPSEPQTEAEIWEI